MADPARRIATYQDVLDAPPNVIAELISGQLHVQPRPAKPHARAASRLGIQLGGPFDLGQGGPGGWILIDEPELHLQDDVVVPDIAGWRKERVPDGFDTDEPFFRLVPDWICEVLSPSTEAIDRTDKLTLYAREDIDFVWLVDPIRRTLEALRLERGRWMIAGVWRDDAVVRAEPFDAVDFHLAWLWEDVRK